MATTMSLSKISLALCAGLALTGCASGLQWNAKLESAQALYEEVSQQRDVQLFASAEMTEARTQLDQAEKSARYFQTEQMVNHKAELARTRIMIAQQRARAGRANETLQQLQAMQTRTHPVVADAMPQDPLLATTQNGSHSGFATSAAMGQTQPSFEPAIGAALPQELQSVESDEELQQLRHRIVQLEQQLRSSGTAGTGPLQPANAMPHATYEDLQAALSSMNAYQTDAGMTIALGDRYFLQGTTELAPRRASRHLDRVAALLLEYPNLTVNLEGHTDNNGNSDDLLTASADKADAVRDALVERGIQIQRIDAIGYGDARPIASNDNDLGRLRNNRVDIVFPETAVAMR